MKLMDSLKSLFSNKKSVSRILDGKISFETYRHYHLREKGFPESCLREQDRQLVEKFGYFVAEGFDWVLLRKYPELITKTLLSDESNDVLQLSKSYLNYTMVFIKCIQIRKKIIKEIGFAYFFFVILQSYLSCAFAETGGTDLRLRNH